MPTLFGGCLSGLSAAFKRPSQPKVDEKSRLLIANVGGRPGDAAMLRTDRGEATNASFSRSGEKSRVRKAEIFKVTSVRSESPGVDELQRPKCSLRLQVDERGLLLSTDGSPSVTLAAWPYEQVALYGWSRDSFRLVLDGISDGGGKAAATAAAAASHLTFFTAPSVGYSIFSAVQRHEAENRRQTAAAAAQARADHNHTSS